MTILVTGGAGFIGANFIAYMLSAHPDYQVVCLDKLTYAANPAALHPFMEHAGFRFVQGDICDRDMVDQVFRAYRPDWVVNFAAESHVDRSITDPSVFLQTNVLGTQVLMDACIRYRAARFHQVSTDEVYGDLPLDRPDLVFTEESPLRPSSPYSASKAAADLLVGAYHRTYGLPATVSRCVNNYGPWQFPEKLIPLMVLRAMKDQSLPVYGTGENVREWLYVQDHCRAIDRILHDGAAGQVYNIGSGARKSNISLVRSICAALGKPETLIRFTEDRKGHDLRYAVDSSKIKAALGWEPLTDFSRGLCETIRWYSEHSDRWAAVPGRTAQKEAGN